MRKVLKNVYRQFSSAFLKHVKVFDSYGFWIQNFNQAICKSDGHNFGAKKFFDEQINVHILRSRLHCVACLKSLNSC